MRDFIDTNFNGSEISSTSEIRRAKNDVPDGPGLVPDDVPDCVTDVPDGPGLVPDNVPTLTEKIKKEKFFESKELILYEEIKKNPRLDVEDYGKLLNVTSRSVKRYLSLLKHKGYIERCGNNKNGYWKIKKVIEEN